MNGASQQFIKNGGNERAADLVFVLRPNIPAHKKRTETNLPAAVANNNLSNKVGITQRRHITHAMGSYLSTCLFRVRGFCLMGGRTASSPSTLVVFLIINN